MTLEQQYLLDWKFKVAAKDIFRIPQSYRNSAEKNTYKRFTGFVEQFAYKTMSRYPTGIDIIDGEIPAFNSIVFDTNMLPENWWSTAQKTARGKAVEQPIPTIQNLNNETKQKVYDTFLPAYRALKESFDNRRWYEWIFNHAQYTAEHDSLNALTGLMLSLTGGTKDDLEQAFATYSDEVTLERADLDTINERIAQRKNEIRAAKNPRREEIPAEHIDHAVQNLENPIVIDNNAADHIIKNEDLNQNQPKEKEKPVRLIFEDVDEDEIDDMESSMNVKAYKEEHKEEDKEEHKEEDNEELLPPDDSNEDEENLEDSLDEKLDNESDAEIEEEPVLLRPLPAIDPQLSCKANGERLMGNKDFVAELKKNIENIIKDKASKSMDEKAVAEEVCTAVLKAAQNLNEEYDDLKNSGASQADFDKSMRSQISTVFLDTFNNLSKASMQPSDRIIATQKITDLVLNKATAVAFQNNELKKFGHNYAINDDEILGDALWFCDITTEPMVQRTIGDARKGMADLEKKNIRVNEANDGANRAVSGRVAYYRFSSNEMSKK